MIVWVIEHSVLLIGFALSKVCLFQKSVLRKRQKIAGNRVFKINLSSETCFSDTLPKLIKQSYAKQKFVSVSLLSYFLVYILYNLYWFQSDLM